MSIFLKCKQVVVEAQMNLILSASVTKLKGKSAPIALFQYFFKSFPDSQWFRIPTLVCIFFCVDPNNFYQFFC
jgi:hypothetical protein